MRTVFIAIGGAGTVVAEYLLLKLFRKLGNFPIDWACQSENRSDSKSETMFILDQSGSRPPFAYNTKQSQWGLEKGLLLRELALTLSREAFRDKINRLTSFLSSFSKIRKSEKFFDIKVQNEVLRKGISQKYFLNTLLSSLMVGILVIVSIAMWSVFLWSGELGYKTFFISSVICGLLVLICEIYISSLLLRVGGDSIPAGIFWRWINNMRKIGNEIKNKRMNKQIRKTESGREVVRFQFEIDPDLWESLEHYQQLGRISTKRELLNNALTLFRWAAKHKELGHSIVALSSGGNTYEIELPCLDSIEVNSEKRLRLVS